MSRKWWPRCWLRASRRRRTELASAGLRAGCHRPRSARQISGRLDSAAAVATAAAPGQPQAVTPAAISGGPSSAPPAPNCVNSPLARTSCAGWLHTRGSAENARPAKTPPSTLLASASAIASSRASGACGLAVKTPQTSAAGTASATIASPRDRRPRRISASTTTLPATAEIEARPVHWPAAARDSPAPSTSSVGSRAIRPAANSANSPKPTARHQAATGAAVAGAFAPSFAPSFAAAADSAVAAVVARRCTPMASAAASRPPASSAPRQPRGTAAAAAALAPMPTPTGTKVLHSVIACICVRAPAVALSRAISTGADTVTPRYPAASSSRHASRLTAPCALALPSPATASAARPNCRARHRPSRCDSTPAAAPSVAPPTSISETAQAAIASDRPRAGVMAGTSADSLPSWAAAIRPAA